MNNLDISWDLKIPITEYDRIEIEDGKIVELNLCRIRLTKLPDSIGKLSKLEKLNLDNNKLTELPKSIGELTNLKRLHLGNNPKSREELLKGINLKGIK